VAHRAAEFEILGQRYTIRSDASPEYVRELVAYMEGKIREIQEGAPNQEPLKTSILAALTIVDELFQAREGLATQEADLARAIQRLIERLQTAVPPPPSR